jgi:DNA-directed RNA polymerase subunit alpha
VSPSIPNATLNLTIDEIDLPTRIYNSLRNGGIDTIGQLVKTSKKDLLDIRNLGRKSIEAIEDKLKEKGLSLAA